MTAKLCALWCCRIKFEKLKVTLIWKRQRVILFTLASENVGTFSGPEAWVF
jgi:hypothetical protein